MGLAGEIEIISSVRIGIFPILCTFVFSVERGNAKMSKYRMLHLHSPNFVDTIRPKLVDVK